MNETSENIWRFGLATGWQWIEWQWGSAEPDLGKQLAASGFDPCPIKIGQDFQAVAVEIHERERNRQGKDFFANILTTSRCYLVHVEDLPSLLKLLQDLVPILRAVAHDQQVDQMLEVERRRRNRRA